MEELELVPRRNGNENENPASHVADSPSLVLGGESSSQKLGGTASNGSGRRNPPARNTSRFWFERFLSVIQRQNPSVIDSSFLSQIAPNNEGKLLDQLKFLHLIGEDGRATALLSMLNMVGAEQKKGFQKVIQEAYSELISEVMVEKAVPEDVINFFIRRYAFTRDKAVNAAKFFLYLAEKGSLPVSQELSSFLTEKTNSNGGSASASSGSGSLGPAAPRIQERIKSPRIISGMQRKTSARRVYFDGDDASAAGLQTVINIKLDKDTPKEYWDRVLAIIGERKSDGEELATSREGLPSAADSHT